MQQEAAGKITALEVQKKNKERVNVYLDDAFAFGLNLMDAAALRKGQVLTQADITRLQYGDAVVRAVDAAANFLSYRPRSSAEVRQNLQKKKKYPAEVIAAAMERLTALGYLDDEAFARYWVDNRNTFKPRSPLALRVELRQKGVPDSIIQQVVETVDTHDAAYRAASKKLSRYRGGDVMTFKQKMGSFLQRQGFRYEDINEVLNQLIEELAEHEPDFFVEA